MTCMLELGSVCNRRCRDKAAGALAHERQVFAVCIGHRCKEVITRNCTAIMPLEVQVQPLQREAGVLILVEWQPLMMYCFANI